ncbi:helix-turn-helix domain-containing protein [Oscillibacter sp. MSJ-2]|uniref:Helix-turn-helix domain-containing protein n=1 Tax=Dysosmobacter acutus TaxID=2841504 RepID=A0ABS6F7D3_9FIRM|nr:helix-turn-helix domain-containing protein [Dysosmobacter acutus]MBU5626175.1 helix-turn-helix domain-containing protein [Dysosmobacter acutus]
MTIGQRIAQKRKEQNLSQESLGDALGVSRQAIYKWESDATLPEIEKLIAMSRLFRVSVGWLLGVEEELPSDLPPAELTDTQLKMVEEIVERYIQAQPPAKKSSWGKWDVRILFALCGILLALLMGMNSRVKQLDSNYDSLQNSISRVERSVDSQIGGISGRVEEILKAQNSLTADYGAEIASADLKENRITFSVHAVPKTYTEGMSVEFSIDNGTDSVSYIPGERAANGGFTATLACRLTDSINISAVFTSADGTRQTQLLERFGDLYTSTLPAVDLMTYDHLLYQKVDESGRIPLPETYVSTRPAFSVYAVNGDIGQSEIGSVRVGLFKNRSLIAWLEPCDQPDSFHGDLEDFSFFRLTGGTYITMTKDSDQLCFAAVVTDEYGRELVYSDIPYILQDGELTWPNTSDISNHDPADWRY